MSRLLKRISLSLVLALSVLSAGLVSTTSAGEVVLNPGFVAGTMQMGSERIITLNASASFQSFSSSQRLSPIPVTSVANYNLTVNVPQGTTPEYKVGGFVDFIGHGNSARITFSDKTVPVTAFATTTVNFGTATPALLQGTITVNGGRFKDAGIRITPSNQDGGYRGAQTRALPGLRLCDGTGSNSYCFPVFPDSNTSIRVSILTDGGQPIVVEKFVSVGPGTTTVDFTVDFVPLPTGGNIAGTITVNGPKPIVSHRVDVFCPFNRATLNANGSYLFSDLAPGPCTMQASTEYDNTVTPFGFSGTTFRYPQSDFSDNADFPNNKSIGRPTVISGETITVDINSDQAFLQGNFGVSGTKSLSEVTSLDTRAFGTFGSPSAGGRGIDTVDLLTGDYELVLSPGDWSNYFSIWRFQNFSSDLAELLNGRVSYQDFKVRNDPQFFVNIVAGQTATQDFNHKFGDVSITFSVVGGGLLSFPSLSGSCTRRNESNQTLYTYTFSAFGGAPGIRQENVQEGIVNFTGQEATCTVTAVARVGGSNVIFGRFTIDVVAGAEIIVDIGGPTLDVQFPVPDEVIDATSIVVTGKVTDDVGVAGVTVNGVAATSTSTGNPNDPAEVSFSATIPIVKGPN